jgi:beta-lactamase class A
MRRTILALALSAVSTLAARPDGLREHIAAVAARFPGELGVFAKDLRTDQTVEWNADGRFPTASVIKIAVLVEAFEQIARGRLQPAASIRVREAAKVGGSGVVRELHDGAELTVRDLLRLMIVLSDNTATNMLLEHVGVANVNARMAAYGLRETKIFRPTFGRIAETDADLEREFGLGMSTPREAAALMERVATGRAVSPDASKEMVEILAGQRDRQMIARRLPLGQPGLVVANKTGTDEEKRPDASGVLGHVRADVALVRGPGVDYVIAIFARRVRDESWTVDHAALVAGADISRAVFDRFSRP